MTFLNPLVLLGLIAAGIPLIIHLFNFRRPQRIDFSSLAFVRELEKTTMRRVRIKQWLLLLMRTLALAALVLAFARPTLTGRLAHVVGGDARAAVGILIDNSRSMTLRDTRGEVLGQALEASRAIVEQARDGDEFYLLTTAGPTSNQIVAFRNREGVLDYISEVTAGDGTVDLVAAASRLGGDLAESPLLNKELYVVADAQSATFGDSSATALTDETLVRLVKLNDRVVDNVGVASVRVESRIVEVGQPVTIVADFTNYGRRDIEGYVASVFLDDQRVAQATLSIAAGETATARFTATAATRGWLEGTVVGEEDDYPYDDKRYFALHVPEERRVLIVAGEGEPTNHLELALSPQLSRDDVLFDVTRIVERDLPAQPVESFDAVVLVGLASVSSGEIATLSQYVDQGGGLLIFPGDASDFTDLDALLMSVGGGRVTGMLGETSVETVELEHPLFSGVFDEQSLAQGRSVEQFGITTAAVYQPGGGSEQTLIGLSSGSPFMQEIRHGSGASLFIAVAPNPSWSDFPVRGLFVPLLYRSIFYLSAGEQLGGDDLTVGRPGEIRLTGVSRDSEVRLVAPSGDEILPETRNLFGALLLQTSEQITEAGVYEIRAGNEIVRRVAYNLRPDESDLSMYRPDEAADVLGGALEHPVSAISGRDTAASEIQRAIQTARTGVELWNVSLVLALLFLAAEMLIEKRWRPEASA